MVKTKAMLLLSEKLNGEDLAKHNFRKQPATNQYLFNQRKVPFETERIGESAL